MAAGNRRVMVIGLDAATFDYMDPLIAQGRMPTLQGLIERGSRAVARSVSPYMTPAAWPSIYTGCRPDKHGIHGWFEGPYSGLTQQPVSAATVRVRAIWDYLNEAGAKVGIMNVPLTYPAPQVSGFVVAGFDSPFENPAWTDKMSYPPEIWAELNRDGDYKLIELLTNEEGDPELDPLFWSRRPPPDVDWTRHFANWVALEARRADLFVKLCQREQPDFSFIVFHPADYFGHRGTRNAEYVLRAYELCDQLVARCLKAADEDTVVIIVSDHGMNEVADVFFVNRWLEDEGFLRFRPEPERIQVASALADMFSFEDDRMSEAQRRYLMEQWLEQYDSMTSTARRAFGTAFEPRYPGMRFGHANIDWEATTVFYGGFYGQFFINRPPGDEYDAIADDFICKAQGLQNERTGQPLFAQVRRADQVYEHFEAGRTPDLLGDSADYAVMFDGLYQHYLKASKQLVPVRELDHRFQLPQYGFAGDHTPYGVFIAAGPGVREGGSCEMVDIIDVAPTAMAILGVAKPKGMDGRVLTEILTDRPAKMSESDADIARPESDRLMESEAESIRQTLRKLGYKL